MKKLHLLLVTKWKNLDELLSFEKRSIQKKLNGLLQKCRR